MLSMGVYKYRRNLRQYFLISIKIKDKGLKCCKHTIMGHVNMHDKNQHSESFILVRLHEYYGYFQNVCFLFFKKEQN